MVVGERTARGREKEVGANHILASVRCSDFGRREEVLQKEIEERVASQKEKEAKVSERLAQLDAAVKVYQDKADFSRRMDLRKRRNCSRLRREKEKVYGPPFPRSTVRSKKQGRTWISDILRLTTWISQMQSEISQANLKITSLTTGGVEQADNIRTAMENLKQAPAFRWMSERLFRVGNCGGQQENHRLK